MSKIQKTSKVINVTLSVLFWVIVALAAICIVVFSTILIKNGDYNTGMNTQLILGNYRITMVDGIFNNHVKPMTVLLLANVTLIAVFGCYVIKVLKRIFQPMSQGIPFDGSVSKTIRKLAWAELIFGIVGLILNGITNTVLYKMLDIPSLFSPDKVSSCSLNIVSDGSFIVWFILLILLSHIFKYGEALQQLSDETL